MKNYCTFYIVRHGETEWNKKGIIQGQSNSLLTKRGIRQADKISEELINIRFDKIYSSDLLRCKQTAEIIALPRKLTVNLSPLLREKSFGRWEGKTYAKIHTRLKSKFTERKRLSDQEALRFKLDADIETEESVARRIKSFLCKAAINNIGQKILVVTSGGVIRPLLVTLGFARYAELPAGSVANTGYIILHVSGSEFLIQKTVGVHKNV